MDDRLSLAASLYTPCDLGADIGTDHGFLPCHLLESGVCRRMILADVSPSALSHAQALVVRKRLGSRATLICADGLDALTEPAGCVSITGMGGETMSEMLLRGQDKLQGAHLVLSAHTDLAMVRQTICDIGYRLTHEELCRAAGRYYLVWKAVPGAMTLTEDELLLGTPLLLRSGNPLLPGYLAWRIAVTEKKLQGMLAATEKDDQAIAALQRHIELFKEAHNYVDRTAGS